MLIEDLWKAVSHQDVKDEQSKVFAIHFVLFIYLWVPFGPISSSWCCDNILWMLKVLPNRTLPFKVGSNGRMGTGQHRTKLKLQTICVAIFILKVKCYYFPTRH